MTVLTRVLAPIAGPLLALACSTGGEMIAPPAAGALEIRTPTIGATLDADGYTVAVDSTAPHSIGVNDSLRLDTIHPGSHTLTLAGLARNCAVQGDNPVAATVASEQTAAAVFTIVCTLNHAPVPADVSHTGGGDLFSLWAAIADQTNLGSVHATDADGDSLTYGVAVPPTHGTLVMQMDGELTYTPTPGYHGPDRFTWRVTDGLADTAITVAFYVNAAPVAVSDTFYVAAGSMLTVVAPGVLANDYDPDGDRILALAASPSGVPDPAHGMVQGFGYNGSLTYTPDPGFTGIDRFSYRVSEDNDSQSLESQSAEVVIIVQ
jgi:hypothetical protein